MQEYLDSTESTGADGQELKAALGFWFSTALRFFDALEISRGIAVVCKEGEPMLLVERKTVSDAIRFLNLSVQFMCSRFCADVNIIRLPLICHWLIAIILYTCSKCVEWLDDRIYMLAITEASLPCWSARSNASGCNADQTRSKATQFTMIVVALQPVDACCQIVSKLLQLSQSLPNDTTSGFAVAMCTSLPAAAAGTSGCCKQPGKGFPIHFVELTRSSDGRQVIHSFQFFTVESAFYGLPSMLSAGSRPETGSHHSGRTFGSAQKRPGARCDLQWWQGTRVLNPQKREICTKIKKEVKVKWAILPAALAILTLYKSVHSFRIWKSWNLATLSRVLQRANCWTRQTGQMWPRHCNLHMCCHVQWINTSRHDTLQLCGFSRFLNQKSQYHAI